MGYSSSLQDWIDEERKRKEAEALAKQKAADAARRAALAQAANLPAPMQGPTMAGPSLAQAPQQGPTMAGPSLAQAGQPPAPAFDTSALSAQQPITATPQPIAPKPAPISVSTKIAKPAPPTFMDLSPELAQPDAPLQPAPMQGPQRPVDDPNDPIHNALNRWRTSDQPDILGQLTKYRVQPYKPPQLDNGFGGTGAVDLGATGTIGGNTIPTAGTLGTMPGTQPGQTLPGGAQPNQWINLDSWKPQQGPTQSGNWLNDTINSAVKPFASGNPNEFVQNWLATTPGGQEVKANMDKRWQNQNQMNGGQYLWNNALDAMDVVSTGPRRFIEDTQIPGLNLSAGQALSAAGQGLNRAINPLSANYQKDAGTGPAYKSVVDFSKQNLPSSVAGAVAPFLPLANVWDNVSSNIAKAQAVNNYVKALPPEQQSKVQIALTNITSGPERTQQTINDILNQNKTAATYTQQAQAALAKSQDMTLPPDQRNQAALQAAQLGKQANDEKNYSALDYVDKNRNPWADMAASLVTDPIQYLPIDKAFEGYKAWKTAKIFDVSPEEAMSVLPKALEDAQKILGKVVTQDATKLVDAGAPKLAPLAATDWEKINPLALTPETKAQQATTKLWNAATQLIGNVSTKEDARLLIQTWIDNPTKLIEGLTGLTSPTAKAVSDQGALRVGAGVIANKPLLEVMPILQGARDALTKLESLAGEGAFNPAHLASELDNVFYDSARNAYGLNVMDQLPTGVAKTAIRRLSDGTGVIDYLDNAGKVLKSSTPEVYANAQASYKALQGSIKASAGQGSNLAKTVWGAQRALLSDMYLTLNPGHWVRNAASATATLLTDHNYGVRNQAEMIDELTGKLGMIPNRELQGAVSGMAEKLPHWTERFAPGNPYAKLVDKANDVWGGLTTLGGSVPFGEESFRLNGFYNAFQRSFKQSWSKPVQGEFKAGLQALGVDPALAKSITQHVIDAGIGGSKADIANTAREVLSGNTIRQGLREIGVPDELLSMGGWGKLKDVLSGHLPEQVDEATNAVRQIFTEEMVAKGQILNDAPPQMGNYKWSEIELAHDNAALIDSLREAGKQAGINPQQIEQTVRDIAPKLEQSMSGTWDKFRADLAQATNPQEALNHALDTWARHSEMKQAARAEVDELGRNAASAQSSEVWAKKWQDTQGIVDRLTQDTGRLFDDARARMNGVSQNTAPIYDRWKAIERYINYDEAAVNEARTAGMGLGQATADTADHFAESINANRAYVDKHTLELYDAFRRNPTQESFDMLVNAQKHIDHMGAQAADYLRQQRELLFDKKISLDKYHQIRNQTWGQFADNAVIHNKATQRYIVADGVTSKFKEALSWDDPFYGQMRVIAPDAAEAGTTAPARYMVMGPDGKMQSVGASYVPNDVKAAFEKIVNHDEVVDSVMADIAKTAPAPAPRPPTIEPIDAKAIIEQQGGRTATELADEARAARNAPRPLEGSAIQEKIGQAQSSGRELASARDTMKAQWDREVSAHWKLPSLDNLLARYERKGVVNVPENMFEDIYGTTVAGHRINGQADVEALLSEYAQVKSQAGMASKMAEEGAATMEDLHSVARSAGVNTLTGAGNPNDQYLLNAINTERKAQKMKALTLEQLQRDPAMREQAAELLMNKIGPEGGPTIHGANWDPHKLEAGETVEKVLADNTTKSKSINGMKAPEMGEVLGSHMIEQLQAAERKIIDQLPGILSGKPNQLTEAQRLGAMDLLNKILPHFDNAVATASKGATDATDFAMLNFTNRRNFDSILGMVFPYHYFWTRSAANWAQRVMAKPGVLLKYYNLQKAIELENQQQNLPARLQGTIPNPVNQFGVGPERLGNPMTWILPFSSYTGSSYGRNPDDAGTDYEKWLLSVQKFTPGLMPALQAIQNVALDRASPLPNGEKRFDVRQYTPQNFIPGIDLAGLAGQAITGKQAANFAGTTENPVFGDKYDPYRIGRKASELELKQHLPTGTGSYVQQMALNIANNKDPNYLIPQEYQAIVAKLYPQATQQAAQDRLWAKAGTFLTGNAGYAYSPEEQKMQQEQSMSPKLGYDEWSNPFGSKQAISTYRAQHPELQSFSTKSALVPGSTSLPPAIRAQKTEYYAEADKVYQAQAKGITDFLLANPNASKKELDAAKQPFYDQIDALKAKYKSALDVTSDSVSDKEYDDGSNPKEAALARLEELLKFDGKAPEYPGRDAPKDKLQAYYAAKGEWDMKRLDYLDKNLNQLQNEEPSYPSRERDELVKLTKGEYTSELARKYQELKYAPDVEKSWSDRMSLSEEMTAAKFAESDAKIKAALGDDAAAKLKQYYDLPKGSDARKAFMKANPILEQAFMISFHPQEYEDVKKKFGNDAWDVLNSKPAYPTDKSDASMQAYYKQLDAYNKAHPNTEQISLYVKGRPYKYDPASKSVPPPNFGADYAEVMRLFPNIWKDKANFPTGADKKTIAIYIKNHPDLAGYNVWYKEHSEMTAPAGPEPEDLTKPVTPEELAAYKGPRPVGSNRQPVGTPYADPASDLYGKEPPVQKWDLGAMGFPSGKAAATTPSASKTGAQYIAEGEKASQEKYFKEHGYYPGKSPKYLKWLESQAAYAERRKGVATEFGEEGAKTWEAYGKLPKGSKARDDYKAAHPELRMYDMAAYNPKEYAAAKKQFGDKAWAEWANVPAYANTPEAQAARQAYFDAHPTAKLMNAWVNGRPSAQGEQAGDPSTGFKYNFGADYAAAQKQFGPNIWDLYSAYNTGWDKGKKADFMKKNPQFTQFMNWWYGNSQNSAMGAQRGAYAGGGAFHGYGGGGGGGYSAPHRGQGTALMGLPKVQEAQMDQSLKVGDYQLQQLRQWKPHNIDLSWMKAGADIGPENLKKWKR